MGFGAGTKKMGKIVRLAFGLWRPLQFDNDFVDDVMVTTGTYDKLIEDVFTLPIGGTDTVMLLC